MNFSDSIESPVKFDHIFSPLASGLKMTIKELVMREREREHLFTVIQKYRQTKLCVVIIHCLQLQQCISLCVVNTVVTSFYLTAFA